MALDIGDAVDPDRFVAADESAQAGGLLEYRPEAPWWRYSAATSLLVTVAVAPATGALGALAVTLYGYPGVDLSRLVRQTLQTMGVLAEGETPRAEDASLVQEALNEIHQGLRYRGLAARQDLAWTLDAVPMFAARPYAVMAGDLLADTFGLSAQRAGRLAQRAVQMTQELSRQTQMKTSGDPVDMDPYAPPEGEFVSDYGRLA
jgi:hypothetical protein